MNISKAYIYKIKPKNSEECVYIGSTKTDISKRYFHHGGNYLHWKKYPGGYRKVSVYDMFDKYEYCNCEIIVIDELTNVTKDELLKLETKRMGEYPQSINVSRNNGGARMICKCGCDISVTGKYSHEKTKKHKHNLQILQLQKGTLQGHAALENPA